MSTSSKLSLKWLQLLNKWLKNIVKISSNIMSSSNKTRSQNLHKYLDDIPFQNGFFYHCSFNLHFWLTYRFRSSGTKLGKIVILSTILYSIIKSMGMFKAFSQSNRHVNASWYEFETIPNSHSKSNIITHTFAVFSRL